MGIKRQKKAEDQKLSSAEKPISLRPLKVEEAISDLLQVGAKEKLSVVQDSDKLSRHGRRKRRTQ